MHRSSPTAFIAFIRDWRSVVEDTPIGQLLGNSQILDTQAPFWSGFPEPRSHNIYWRSEASGVREDRLSELGCRDPRSNGQCKQIDEFVGVWAQKMSAQDPIASIFDQHREPREFFCNSSGGIP